MFRRRAALPIILAAACAASILCSCASDTAAPPPTPAATARPAAAHLVVQVLAVYPHDPQAFTQGLLWYKGLLYESTGLQGRSSVREVDPPTGIVRRRHDVDRMYFGEGLARIDDRLIQLTWENRLAFVYDLNSFATVGQFSYDGQGWGLCDDGEHLVMSDGTPILRWRDRTSFAVVAERTVMLAGEPVTRINELECVGDLVYANVWQTDSIVAIDAHTGTVAAVIDASGLLTPQERAGAEVLNGIAYDEEHGTFLLTGKLWPKLFAVRFVPAPR